MVWHYLKKMAQWLMPHACIFCGQKTLNIDVCTPCLNDLPHIENPCKRCSRSLTGLNLQCGFCLNHRPAYDATHALFSYRPPITKLIMQLKFNHILANARVLGELLTLKIQQEWYVGKPLPDLIIPVPLHTKRLRERGFNQAVEIARPISKKLTLPMHHCSRIKYTHPQATLLAEERVKNMRGAFLITQDLTNKTVAVVDDVITTGQTINEFCKTLKKAGAKRIDVWCCARAIF
jgi:ComF family protein